MPFENPLIAKAVAVLRAGGLVAFATETVYGLGADATNSAAVQKIFTAKGRPSTNPLIVHVAGTAVARRYAADWPDIADRLAERFWPGPLTLVVCKTRAIVDAVAAGGNTVGLRVPDHPLALQLLRAFDGPVAAPSANRSNQISPTEAAHVRAELGGRVDLILDGGPCTVGIESTVLDLTTSPTRILRPGGVSRAQIESIIGPVDQFQGHVDSNETAVSPGQHLRHYSPRTPAFRFDEPSAFESYARTHGRTAALLLQSTVSGPNITVTRMPADPANYAREFYRLLRLVDEQNFDAICIETPPADPAWDAVHDRIRRATVPI